MSIDNPEKLSPVEIIKAHSDHLRGSIAAELENNLSGGVAESDQNLIKFHGIYQQDHRDRRAARARRKLEPDYSFMIRLRVPGGLLTPAQWLAVDSAAAELSEAGSLRLTTRQTLQFHGVAKENLRALLSACARRLLDSIAACGDVNRNVMCSPHRGASPIHAAAYAAAAQISAKLLPASRAYYEIWLGEEKLAGSAPETEPLYGERYLPRKFKVGVAVPPSNDVDIYSQDIGFVAVAKGGILRGFNVLAGGGLGMTRGDARTYPRLATEIGLCRPQEVGEVAWHLAALQRDYGARDERKQARFKYTIDRLGVDFVRDELTRRLGFDLAAAAAVKWQGRGDFFGWKRRASGLWDLGLFVANGRLSDGALRQALREIAAVGGCYFMLTPNQNIIITDIAKTQRARLLAIFDRLGVEHTAAHLSGLRKSAMACVALPTCPLAMAEAERYLPSLLDKLERELSAVGLSADDITLRITGCPNGCVRPYLGEIGLVGRAAERYDLYLGASAKGTRLSSLAAVNLDEAGIIDNLRPLFLRYAEARHKNERFGDFLIRIGRVRAPRTAADFHQVADSSN